MLEKWDIRLLAWLVSGKSFSLFEVGYLLQRVGRLSHLFHHKDLPPWSNYLPKVPSSNIRTLGINLQHINCWGCKHTVASNSVAIILVLCFSDPSYNHVSVSQQPSMYWFCSAFKSESLQDSHSRWWHRKILKSPSLSDTLNLQLHMKKIALNKTPEN